jgi:hypothetical protein
VPFTVDGSTPRETSQQDIDRLRKQVDADQRDQLYWSPDVPRSSLIRLWDVVNGTQTSPFDPQHVYNHYLRKVVFKCSACNYTSTKADLVPGHIRETVKALSGHQGVSVTDFMGPNGLTKICDGCGEQFTSHPMNVYKHIDNVIKAGPLHVGATELVINRFSLTPPVLAEAPTPVVASDDQETETRQLERSQEPRRRRHRNRHRSR